MKSLISNSILLGLAMATASVVACSSGPSTTGGSGNSHPMTGQSETTGSVGMKLTLPSGATLSSVQYTLTNGGGTVVQSGTVTVNNSQSIDFQLGLIPAGSGYSITLTSSTDGGVSCIGTAGPFTVTAHTTVAVSVNLICSVATPDAGNVYVSGVPVFCAQWTSLATVNPNGNGSEVNADGTTLVTFSATAVSSDPANVTYTYTQSNPIGTFGTNTPSGLSDTMTYTCDPSAVTRMTTVTLAVAEVSDGGVNSACPASTVTALITCDGVSDAGVVIDSGTVDTGTADTGTVDTGTADTGTVDTGTVDTGTADTGTACVNSVNGSAGFTQGEGANGTGSTTCNQTELAFARHSEACLQCMLNASGLHDVQGDPGPDCDDLTGTVTTGPAAGTSNVTTCLGVLTCAIGSGCFSNNVADCFCGFQASAAQCNAGPGDTSATGVCKTSEEAAIGTVDPVYFNKHLTDLTPTNNTSAPPNGGAVANTLLNIARTSCANICF